eukprot:CAMPEP_0194161010 /NCGR_PEP_ID=MMETSP0152-20130528/78704_1 /TAXON_ID=1049557 /ORGANISM="Thalassiothrix antarctica, Strain L6-D1" /LENGTH=351 /DNA_ID=CAMNT_0038870757 /DNA_START=820 /DNA_END=1875 /DNA_ORIENTATION=+
MPLSPERKEEYFVKMKELLSSYSKLFVVEIDNVGSMQLQMTRKSLRGKAEVLMGKNTMMRKVISDFVEENPGTPVEKLKEMCRGNVGFVFTNGDLGEIREILESNTRPAPARVGSTAPSTVVVPKGPTGCDPGQTAFFQTLQISTKITKGQIEITNDVNLITEGEKVTASMAVLLQKLNIEPFTYGLNLKAVYDGGSLFDAKVLDITNDVLAAKFGEALSSMASVCLLFDAKVLDITNDVLAAKFGEALSSMASFCLALNFPTMVSVPHSLANAFKAIVSITIGLDKYTFDKAEIFKDYLADPSKFASAGGSKDSKGAEEKVVEEEPDEEEEADIGGGMDMFGGEEKGGDY